MDVARNAGGLDLAGGIRGGDRICSISWCVDERLKRE
jgi:hypothetical protein